MAALLCACDGGHNTQPLPNPDEEARTTLRGACILAMRQRWPGGDGAAVYPTAGWPVLEQGDGSAVVLVPLKGGAGLQCRVRRVSGGVSVESLG